MTIRLLERCARLCRLTWLALLLGLAACGPGTGGTGTGPVMGTLGFSGAGGATTAAPGLPCATACDRVDLRLEESRVELVLGCGQFVFSGAWAVDGTGQAVLQGTWQTTTASGVTTVPATLRLQFSEREPASSQVTVTLSNAAGTVLLGPLVLQRNDPLPGSAAPACGKP